LPKKSQQLVIVRMKDELFLCCNLFMNKRKSKNSNNTINHNFMLIKKISLFLLSTIVLFTTSCDSDDNTEISTKDPYVFCLGVTINDATNFYIVTAPDLMSGSVSPVGNGIELIGYRQFQQGNQTLFSAGGLQTAGLGSYKLTAFTRGADKNLQQKGNYEFDMDIYGFEQVDANTMLAIEMPQFPWFGNKFQFRSIDINSASFTGKTVRDMSELTVGSDWPWLTGTRVHGDKVYMTYYHANPTTFETKNTDTTYVAVYSYPSFEFIKIMKDTRTGPAGSYNANNGIVNDEDGNMYVMSSSAITNGYSQSTKNAAFLRIPSGSVEFDDYYFDFETKSGGLKPAHIEYIGNGLALVEVSTVKPQTSADAWSDRDLKSCIVNLREQTITDITDIPVHQGVRAGRFVAMQEGGYVYCPIETSAGTFIYRIDPTTATAVRGLEIQSAFISGLYKIN
jgi:phage pi2 protein 07